MSLRHSLVVFGLLWASMMSIAPGSLAQAQPNAPAVAADALTGEAKKESDAARVLVEVGDFENALVKFQRAYELSNHYRLLWSIAACQNKLRHYSRAQAFLIRYREEGAGKLTSDDLEQAAAFEETLTQFISSVEFEIDEPGTTIFVDDEKVGTSPLAKPWRVDVGKRKFRFEKPGFKVVTVEQTIAGNSPVKIRVKQEKDLHEGKLVVEAGPKDAIMLDGKMMGVGRFEGIVASGGHTLRVTAPGMTAHQTEVLIKDNDVRRIPVTLTPLTKQVDMAKWGWVGGGALLVGVAVVVGALMYTPTKAPEVNTTLGTYPLAFGGRW